MSREVAQRILRALGHRLQCPFRGCTCPAGAAAATLYAEASKVIRDGKSA